MWEFVGEAKVNITNQPLGSLCQDVNVKGESSGALKYLRQVSVSPMSHTGPLARSQNGFILLPKK